MPESHRCSRPYRQPNHLIPQAKLAWCVRWWAQLWSGLPRQALPEGSPIHAVPDSSVRAVTQEWVTRGATIFVVAETKIVAMLFFTSACHDMAMMIDCVIRHDGFIVAV